jgi:hypothetical protein
MTLKVNKESPKNQCDQWPTLTKTHFNFGFSLFGNPKQLITQIYRIDEDLRKKQTPRFGKASGHDVTRMHMHNSSGEWAAKGFMVSR